MFHSVAGPSCASGRFGDTDRRSALAVVPQILDLLPSVKTIVDFGCGAGIWLEEFERAGASRVLGLDFGVGARAKRAIGHENFRQANIAAPITVGRFDLGVSLGLAAQIDRGLSSTFVENLTGASPRILFCASVCDAPDSHLFNDASPQFWIAEFDRRGYQCIDAVRPKIWDDDRVCWCYRQNILLFIDREIPTELNILQKKATFNGVDLRHPDAIQMPVAQADARDLQAYTVAERALARLKKSSFWMMSRPFHRFSKAARKINKLELRK